MDVLISAALILIGSLMMMSMVCVAIGAYLFCRARGTMKP